MRQLIIASSNPGKLREIRAILSDIECIAQNTLGIDDAEETGLSFIENAIIKARHASRIANKPALADDSGLVVAALQGMPGIYSARFAGALATDKENISLLLSKLENIPPINRSAYFYCVMALVQHANDPTPIIVTGKLPGSIVLEPKGHNGFGYDPVFYLAEHNCTLAQLPAQIKNTISHRAQALSLLAAYEYHQ